MVHPSYTPLLYHPNIWWVVQFMKFPIMYFSQVSHYLVPNEYKNTSRNFFWKINYLTWKDLYNSFIHRHSETSVLYEYNSEECGNFLMISTYLIYISTISLWVMIIQLSFYSSFAKLLIHISLLLYQMNTKNLHSIPHQSYSNNS
jgi:hypothetical protein